VNEVEITAGSSSLSGF